MRYLRELLLVGAMGSYFTVTLTAADLKIIANPGVGVSAVSAEELKDVFLETKTSLGNGSHVVPVLLKSGEAHQEFLKQYVDKTNSALETYYRSLVFTGKASMPKIVGSDADAVSYVSRTKGAIGYVSGASRTDGVKVIAVK